MKITNLTKHFGDKAVFDGFSADFTGTDRIALMGASGSGKTTLVRLLLGLEQPDAGSIEGLDGETFSVVFQENRLVETLTVRANLKAVLGKHFNEADALAALDALGLSGEYGTPVQNLSGGMKRRVAIARALLFPHTFLILDEPFKGLDEETLGRVTAYINDATAGRKLLLITHDEAEADALNAKVFRI